MRRPTDWPTHHLSAQLSSATPTAPLQPLVLRVPDAHRSHVWVSTGLMWVVLQPIALELSVRMEPAHQVHAQMTNFQLLTQLIVNLTVLPHNVLARIAPSRSAFKLVPGPLNTQQITARSLTALKVATQRTATL